MAAHFQRRRYRRYITVRLDHRARGACVGVLKAHMGQNVESCNILFAPNRKKICSAILLPVLGDGWLVAPRSRWGCRPQTVFWWRIGISHRPRYKNAAQTGVRTALRCCFYSNYMVRSTISFLISPMALAGFSPLGHVCAQFMMVWQRYSLNGSCRSSRRSPVASSRLSMIQR